MELQTPLYFWGEFVISRFDLERTNQYRRQVEWNFSMATLSQIYTKLETLFPSKKLTFVRIFHMNSEDSKNVRIKGTKCLCKKMVTKYLNVELIKRCIQTHYECVASSFVSNNWSKIFIAWSASMPRTKFCIFINIACNRIESFNLIIFINVSLQNVPISNPPENIPITQLE